MKSLSLIQPHMIVMVGVPGCGKSFFAEKFSDTFNAPYASLEKIMPYATNTEAAESLLLDQVTELFKTRQSIILEGRTDTRMERDQLIRRARTAGYETLLVWVQTDPATAKLRRIRESKDNTVKVLTSEQYDRITKRFTAPNALEKAVVISGKHTYATQAKIILKKLSAPRAEISTHAATPVRSEERSRRNNIIVR